MTKITSVTTAGLLFAFGAGVLVSTCSTKNSADDDPQALCIKTCTRIKECFGTATPEAAPDCAIDCKTRAPSKESLETCTNAAELLAHAKDCTQIACGQVIPCSRTIPACTTTSGDAGAMNGDGASATGGSSGTGGAEAAGGSAGAGGAGGAESDAPIEDPCVECVKADRCKALFSDAGAPNAYTTSCRQTSVDDQEAVITGCKNFSKLIPGCK
jgi:hypothetical protein